MYLFFFQAEDGIRDGHVTGVQTCALPIWTRLSSRKPRPLWPSQRQETTTNAIAKNPSTPVRVRLPNSTKGWMPAAVVSTGVNWPGSQFGQLEEPGPLPRSRTAPQDVLVPICKSRLPQHTNATMRARLRGPQEVRRESGSVARRPCRSGRRPGAAGAREPVGMATILRTPPEPGSQVRATPHPPLHRGPLHEPQLDSGSRTYGGVQLSVQRNQRITASTPATAQASSTTAEPREKVPEAKQARISSPSAPEGSRSTRPPRIRG